MDAALMTWLFFRALRWVSWLGLLVYSTMFLINPRAHFDSFGQLLHSTEAAMYGFTLVAVFAGFLELMMRERAGFLRPTFGKLFPPRKAH